MATVPNSAKAIVQQTLNQYGLGSLINWAWGVYTSAGGGSTGIAAITTDIVNTPQFKTMYPEYDTLAKEGRAMTVQQIQDYRRTATEIFHAAGIPAGFYDTPDAISKFILGNVSTSELQNRVNIAQQEVTESDPTVRAQLRNFYGIDTGHLVAHALDEKVALPILQKQFTSAQIAADAQRANAGLDLTRAQAEGLTALGVTDAQATQGFQNLGTERGLFQAQTAGESTIGVNTQLAAQFGGDTAAQLAFQQRQAQRKAQFQEESGFNANTAGVTGIGVASKAV